MSPRTGVVLLAQSEEDQERILRTALTSQNYAVRSLRRDAGLIAEIDAAVPDPGRPAVLLLDAARAAAERLDISQVAKYLRARHPEVGLAVIASRALAVNDLHRKWVRAHGGIDVFPRVSRPSFATRLKPLLEGLGTHFGRTVDVARLADFEAALLSAGSTEADSYSATLRTWEQLERAGIDPIATCAAMLDTWGVRSEDRSYHGKTYPDCFLGSEAAHWLNTKLAVPRAAALSAGEVARSAGLFYHVTHDHPFKDAALFYRAHRVTDRLLGLDIDLLLGAARSARGIEVRDRRWRGAAFPRCFVGSEAAHWWMSNAGLNLGEAITLGQVLLDLHVFRHVTDGHDFIDREYFYRFAADRT